MSRDGDGDKDKEAVEDYIFDGHLGLSWVGLRFCSATGRVMRVERELWIKIWSLGLLQMDVLHFHRLPVRCVPIKICCVV